MLRPHVEISYNNSYNNYGARLIAYVVDLTGESTSAECSIFKKTAGQFETVAAQLKRVGNPLLSSKSHCTANDITLATPVL